MPERIPDTGGDAAHPLVQHVRRTFSSLKVRNYRLYFIGQTISLCGTWMQTTALGVLVVVALKGSGTALGLVIALQFAPVLLLASYGGVLADRFSKRRLLFITQSIAAVLALTLGVLVATGAIRLWMVCALALVLGLVNALDNPVRQTFVHEMVGPSGLNNAITLNSIITNLSRVIGPAIAGIVILQIGLPLCFIVNGVSFIAVLVCLAMMDARELVRSKPVLRAKGQLREGFAYAWNTPVLRNVLIMMALVGTLTYEFSVSIPLLAQMTFGGSRAAVETAIAVLPSAMGVGAVIGGLIAAGRSRATVQALTVASFGFGAAVLLVSVSPSLAWAALAMGVVGFFSVSFTALTNTILQTSTAARMRGRVMALWAMAFLGSTVIGAPIIGWVAQVAGARWGLVVGAVAALVAGGVGLRAMRAHAGAATELHVPARVALEERESA
jgi:MFS family permease